jgi:hypothetical protein
MATRLLYLGQPGVQRAKKAKDVGFELAAACDNRDLTLVASCVSAQNVPLDVLQREAPSPTGTSDRYP